MTIQVKPVYRKPEEGQGLPGRVLDKDDTQRLLIKARSSVLHMEAGYTTDNLLLSLTVECLAMREETIYVPPRTRSVSASGWHYTPEVAPSLGTSSTSSMDGLAGRTADELAPAPPGSSSHPASAICHLRHSSSLGHLSGLPLLTTVPADLKQGGCSMRPWILITLCLTTGMARASCPETETGTHTEMTRLADQIRQWDHAYHERGESPVSDDIYDQARLRLQRWQQCHPATISVYQPTGGTQRHPMAQTGLNKIHTADQARQWIQARRQQQLWIQPKVDGVALPCTTAMAGCSGPSVAATASRGRTGPPTPGAYPPSRNAGRQRSRWCSRVSFTGGWSSMSRPGTAVRVPGRGLPD